MFTNIQDPGITETERFGSLWRRDEEDEGEDGREEQKDT